MRTIKEQVSGWQMRVIDVALDILKIGADRKARHQQRFPETNGVRKETIRI